MLQAILINSFRAQDTLSSDVEVVAFLGTSLLLQEQILWICRKIPYTLLVFAITGGAAWGNGISLQLCLPKLVMATPGSQDKQKKMTTGSLPW